MTILYNFASRSRPDRFFAAIDNIMNMSITPDYLIVAKLDTDDESMNNDEVKRRLRIYAKLSVQWGQSSSKIHAINRDIPQEGWDILVNMSDDFKFSIYGFDEVIRNEMTSPDLLLHYNDGYANEAVCTLAIMGQQLYKRFGYVYHESYYSMWCDNEQTDIAKVWGVHRYVPVQIAEHMHNTNGKAPTDALYRRNNTYQQDKVIYEKRKAINFGL